jgi:hypothetical protein
MFEENEVAKKRDFEHIGSILEELLLDPEWKEKLQASISLQRWQ